MKETIKSRHHVSFEYETMDGGKMYHGMIGQRTYENIAEAGKLVESLKTIQPGSKVFKVPGGALIPLSHSGFKRAVCTQLITTTTRSFRK